MSNVINFTLIGGLISWLFANVPALNKRIENLTPNGKRLYFATITAVVSIGVNAMAVWGVGGTPAISWSLLGSAIADWVVGFLGTQMWHGVVNKGLA